MERSPRQHDSSTLNCWEFMHCGREPGGVRADDLGVCPAAADGRMDGVNAGRNGGRICWVVAGTFGKGRLQCLYADPAHPCDTCDFFRTVHTTAEIASGTELIDRFQTPQCADNYHLAAF